MYGSETRISPIAFPVTMNLKPRETRDRRDWRARSSTKFLGDCIRL